MNEVHRLVDQLPEPNKRMLELLLRHLEKVALKAEKNMMTVSNLGVCFGPTLLRAEEETVAAIMDIKFGNVVVEILVENWRKILANDPVNNSPHRKMLAKVAMANQPPTNTGKSLSLMLQGVSLSERFIIFSQAANQQLLQPHQQQQQLPRRHHPP